MTDLERLMDETADHYEQKMANLYDQLRQVKNRCISLQKENKHLRRRNNELIRERQKTKQQQRYKNGKRGTFKNG